MERIILDLAQTEAPREGVPSVRRRFSPGELGSARTQDEVAGTKRVDDSTLRVSHLLKTDEHKTDGQADNSSEPPPETSSVNEKQTSSATGARPKMSPAPRVIKVAAPRVIQVGGRSPREMEKEEGEVRGASSRLDTSGMTPVEDLPGDQREDGDRGTAAPTGRFGFSYHIE